MEAMLKESESSIEHLLARNVERVVDKGHLREALRSGRKLRIKLGIDPTTPDLHLGHAVVFWKLREFQELGHKVVLIIGDFTAQVGDPSGKTRTRPPLTEAEVRRNMRDYLVQAGMVLDVRKVEVRYNSEWLDKLDGKKMLQLLAVLTTQQILEREDFRKRLDARQPVHLHELLYPVLQAYDSVAIKADVECGGTDQLLNLLVGRTLMERMHLPPQDVLTTPLLEGLDGVRKMSKSLKNYIALTDEPGEMYGKVMSIPDSLIVRYFWLTTDVPEKEVQGFERALANRRVNPKEVKSRLASEIVARYHGADAARGAAERFEKIFSKRELVGDLPILVLHKEKAAETVPRLNALKVAAVEIVIASKLSRSKSEARRLVVQGGLRVNNEAYKNPTELVFVRTGDVVKVGKKNFFRVKVV
jgi:tyrosyl-tRNA synthetase